MNLNTISFHEKRTDLLLKRIVEEKQKEWSLRLYTPEKDLSAAITDPYLHRPGMAFAGFVKKFSPERLQIIGEIEWSYLDSLSPSERKKALRQYFSFKMPGIFFSKSLVPHKEFLECAKGQKIAVIGTTLSTMDLMQFLQRYLEAYFAPRVTLHASLVDVYGVGMLYTGQPGIGKSECCLDLVERGHRLVADDIVYIFRQENQLMGTQNELIGYHMEIRGLGIIDAERLFGIRAICKEKKIDVVVELVEWAKDMDYERLGIEEASTEILGLQVQKVTLPVSPGKNITVISEVVAMNILLRMRGVNSAKLFNQQLIQYMQNQKQKEK